MWPIRCQIKKVVGNMFLYRCVLVGLLILIIIPVYSMMPEWITSFILDISKPDTSSNQKKINSPFENLKKDSKIRVLCTDMSFINKPNAIQLYQMYRCKIIRSFLECAGHEPTDQEYEKAFLEKNLLILNSKRRCQKEIYDWKFPGHMKYQVRALCNSVICSQEQMDTEYSQLQSTLECLEKNRKKSDALAQRWYMQADQALECFHH